MTYTHTHTHISLYVHLLIPCCLLESSLFAARNIFARRECISYPPCESAPSAGNVTAIVRMSLTIPINYIHCAVTLWSYTQNMPWIVIRWNQIELIVCCAAAEPERLRVWRSIYTSSNGEDHKAKLLVKYTQIIASSTVVCAAKAIIVQANP